MARRPHVLSVRAYPAIVATILVGLALSPLARAPLDDDFPLSTYPMFATPRSTRLTLDYAVAIAADGSRRPVPPALVGSREVLQARAILERAVADGPAAAAALCAQIATRARDDDALAGAVAIAIVTGTHDAVAYLMRGARGPERERARCELAR